VRHIQIEYTNLPEDRILVDSISTIKISFTGRGVSLLNIWAAPPTARCDLSNSTVGEYTMPVQNLSLPFGFGDITINYPTASSITVTIDRLMNKNVTVNVPIKGSLKQGFSISEIRVPDTITITGPREMVRNIRELTTESLNVRNKNASFTKELHLTKQSPLLETSKKIVTAQVEVDTTARQRFVNVPLKLIYAPGQNVWSEKITLDTLIVEGAKNRIMTLKKTDIDVRIQLTKLSPGDYYLPAEVLLPAYIKPVYSNPQRFKIKVY
jgi:YbbR domain-containing protein